MKIRFFWRVPFFLLLSTLLNNGLNHIPAHAQVSDAWWDDNWAYRVPVTVSSEGIAALNINFSHMFSDLGLVNALLDLRSIRVIPYHDGIPGAPIPYEETYSKLIVDTDSLNQDLGSSQPYWFGEEDTTLELDEVRHTEGSGAIKAQIAIESSSLYATGFSYQFNGAPESDWTAYETLLYDVFPEVNPSGIDQTPDVFFFELEGLDNCAFRDINGPPLMMDVWNSATVSLRPYGNCQTPVSSSLDAIRFFVKVNHTSDNPHGYFNDGDEIRLWVDNFRLVDQNGSGEIRWEVEPGIERYYIYFDTLNHEGHPPPVLTTTSAPTASASHMVPEAGGVFHQISGAVTNDLAIWNAPITEKILRTQTKPTPTNPLIIHAARNELEPIQLIVRSPSTRSLSVSISPLVHSNGKSTIPTSQIKLFRVDYIQLTRLSDFYGRTVFWPDPLYPVNLGKKITFPANLNQPIWLRIHVPSSALDGTYTGNIRIGSAVIPIQLQVMGITLPQSSPLNTLFGFDWDLVTQTYGGMEDGIKHPCYDQLISAINETFSNYLITPSTPENPTLPADIHLYSLSAYEIQKAHTLQLQTGEPVWWEFTPQDYPPQANPAVIDRPGLDARILPWLAWLDRVDGLYYPQTTDWDGNPWTEPFSNGLSNGDGFLFYPPKDDTLGYDPCEPESNRLVPSIRLELLREGLEDYAYLWLLNEGNPEINQANLSDSFANAFIASRTAFNRSPTNLLLVRSEIASLLHQSQMQYFLPLVIR